MAQKLIGLSDNDELFQSLIARIEFDGSKYTVVLSCKLHNEDLARKIQKNTAGSFEVKTTDNTIIFYRYDPNLTVSWTKTEAYAFKKLNEATTFIGEVGIRVNSFVAEKAQELKKEIDAFNSLTL